MTLPDWQLPPGVDRGLWDYLRSRDMVAGYDAQVAASPLAAADVRFCDEWFPTPGRLVDLGCGTGRLCAHFAARGYGCVGVDLSDAMLAAARENARNLTPQPPSLGGKGEPERSATILAPPFLGEGLGRGSTAFVKSNLVDLKELPDAGFDYAACLFSTLGMVRGGANRRAALASAFRVLRPGGRLVLHAHNRWFRGLGWRRFRSADVTMPQAYAGAPLTLHHFSRGELVRLLAAAGFRVDEVRPVGLTDGGRLPRAWWRPAARSYGYLVAAARG